MFVANGLSLSKTRKGIRHQILKNIDFQAARGRITLLLGKSGCGKTSLLRCLAQIETEYEGEILIDGLKVNALSAQERCQSVGFVSQSYALFPFMSVLDNCAHPLRTVLGVSKNRAYEMVESQSASLEVGPLLHHYPHELSGGQQQRAAILRALLLNPNYLLLDEPTSALDPLNTNLLIKILRELTRTGKGIIISSQDMHFAQKIHDYTYYLEHGALSSFHDTQRHPPLAKDSQLWQFLYSEQSLVYQMNGITPANG
jgi:ABC-type polar amino acid transport system ATPase subunit